MIYINKGEVNSIVLTLTEVSTLTSPYYLFVFQNEMNPTSDPILFTAPDDSDYPERFNLFYLDEPVDVELMKGQYTYSVYESTIPLAVLIIVITGLSITYLSFCYLYYFSHCYLFELIPDTRYLLFPLTD